MRYTEDELIRFQNTVNKMRKSGYTRSASLTEGIYALDYGKWLTLVRNEELMTVEKIREVILA